MLHRFAFVAALLACAAHAVVVKPFEGYGPPGRPAAQYGPPQRQPHREYGVPQQIPFREYGPPALKYGPPKLNFIGGGQSSGSGFNDQVKTHFGVPKPFYGPPHIQQQHKPAASYGPPPQQSYGPPPRPAQQYGPPPPRPAAQYGPPPPRPAAQYGPPPQQHRPATSYGPPPSGPLNLPPKQQYGPPPPNYGPPPLPNHLPGPRPANFNGGGHGGHETTIIVTGSGGGGHHGGGGGGFHHGGGGGGGHHGHHGGGPIKQVQIQIDDSGHTHSVSGSQAPFHTACDGWKPIPGPVGAYHGNGNSIETQSGYSQVSSGSFGTQYNANGLGGGGGATGSGGGVINGLTDEQLVAVALQSGGFEDTNSIQLHTQGLPTGPGPQLSGPSGPGAELGLNSIESEALQISLGSIDDSYSRPPSDSYAPGAGHAPKFNGPPPPPPGPNYGPPPPRPGGNYGPPQLPSAAAFVHHHHHQNQHHHNAISQSHSAQAGLGLQYGSQSGNLHSFPPRGGAPPNKPVSFRPPVPQGLLESIGATVQHFDQFGVKPQRQPPTYIPPAANEIANSGPGGNLEPEYGPPPLPAIPQPAPAPPPQFVEQQLPQQGPQVFLQVNQQQQQQQQHQQHQFQQQQQHQYQQQQQQHFQQPPPQAPQFNYVPPLQGPSAPALPPPQPQYAPPPPPPNAQYLPPQPAGPGGQFSSTAFEHAYSASQYNQQFVHSQGLPLQQQEPRFQAHDCGHGPNLVGAGYQLQQQQQAGSAPTGYSSISQSIPVAESHTQFIAGPSDSYGPPPSGNDIDHIGFASQKNAVAALPDGTSPEELPGLDGLNVISAQKSQAIQLNSDTANHESQPKYQLDFGAQGSPLNEEQSADHEAILSQGLLQSILSAIEQPQNKDQQQQQQQQQQQHGQAQSRSDHNISDEIAAASDDDTNDEQDVEETAASTKVEIRAPAPADDTEAAAIVHEIKAIIPEEVDEADLEDAKH